MELREQLKLAALAVGIEIQFSYAYGVAIDVPPRRTDTWANWNPRDDDGDSRRLEVALFMEVDVRRGVTEATAPAFNMPGGLLDFAGVAVCHDESDPLAATRMAVLRCAAEIGLSMREQSK
jgi:hypothetical protein